VGAAGAAAVVDAADTVPGKIRRQNESTAGKVGPTCEVEEGETADRAGFVNQ
jgi:hypothetical protein